MHDEIQEIVNPLKKLGIIGFIVFILMFSLSTNIESFYDKNYFEITLNNTPMKCFYKEIYNNTPLIKTGTSSYNNIENRINRINYTENITLNIKEYEVYYKNGNRKRNTTGWYYDEKLIYKEVNNDINIEIKRMNNIIYKGKYIENLNEYINEKGRYYIHIYVNRKIGILSNVKTHITFNVIIGDDNNV